MLNTLVNILNNNYFVDITNLIINNNTNNPRVKDRHYYKKNNIKYYTDDKNVVLNYSKKEKEVANLISTKLNCVVFMIPKINSPKNIETSDYYFKSEFWDLKEIKSNGKNNLDNKIKSKKEQSHNFIFDNSFKFLSEEEIIRQVTKIYKSPKREWVDKIMIIENNKILYIFKRK